ncbi:uncharacterized protein [Amphiura filiformis]|uniref:uncharacterized protein n=1 Tax=Amphiura filiformis TaxID=82378 RepID=UPI003B20FA4A
MKDSSSPAVKRRDKKKATFLRGIGARVSRIFGTQPPRSPTSPARLDHETAQPRVPVITTTDGDDGKIAVTKVEEEDDDVPDVVTKEDIIKMLDFVSETTEQAVYKCVEIRGTISSVDETKSEQELRDASRALRKAVKSLTGTMDSLTKVEEVLKSAPELVSEQKPSPEEDKPAAPVPMASAPIAVDELDEEASDQKDSKPGEFEANEDKHVALNDSLDTVEDFEERKQSVSLMEAIQNTLNGGHSMSRSTNEKVEEEPAVQVEPEVNDNDKITKDENEEKESKIKDALEVTGSEDQTMEDIAMKDKEEEKVKEEEKIIHEEEVKEDNKSAESISDEKKEEHDEETSKATDNE